MIKIINGDCLTEFDSLEAKSVDVVVTSPPYNLNKNYSQYEDNLPYDDYLNWLFNVFVKIKHILKDDGSFFLNVGSTCKNPYIHLDVCSRARQIFTLQNDIVWVKSITIQDECKSYGHFKPINSNRFLNNQHESIFHFTKVGDVVLDRLAIGVTYEHKSNIGRWKSIKKDKRCRGNVWHIPYKTVHSQKNHPAGFPLLLPEMCIKLHGIKDNLLVCDPFLGAGTTMVAAKRLGVNGIGIDIDPLYCQMSEELLESL